MTKIILEPTTNTHQVEAPAIRKVDEKGSTVTMEIQGKGIVTHGEHGTIIPESQHVIKYVQKEFNPVTKVVEDAND